MRNDIAFKTTDGTTLRGWHYLPAGSGRYPTIVMAHGFSAVKEMYLDKFAEAFMQAGFASIVYDNRNLGASDGQPRQELDPWLQVRDYSDAITFARSLEQTDAERIGVWGSSYSGGHVLVVAAIDRRVTVRRVTGSADQRLAELPPARPRRFSCDAAGRIARRSGQARLGRCACDATRCRRGSDGASSTTDC